MKIKFNKFERVAGFFVLSTLVGGFSMLVGVAIKQGWFETKVQFTTTLQNADGVHIGTAVQMAGLRAGSVTSVDLRSNSVVRVSFEIAEKYHSLIREDSVIRTIRPFVISEKVLDISVGNTDLPLASNKKELKSEVTADIMDLISGKTLSPYVDTLGKMMENLRVVAEAILEPSRSKDIIRIFDQMAPLVLNMNAMSKEVTSVLKETNKNKKLVNIVDQLLVTTNEVNKMLPEVNKVMPELAKLAPIMARESPKLAADMQKIAANVAVLTDELQQTLPAIKKAMTDIGPEVPRATRRAMEALDETVVTLKALQRSFILKSNTQEVRQEEAERDKNRVPSSLKPTEDKAKPDEFKIMLEKK